MIYMVGLKVRMTFWWPYVDFKKRPAYRVRNPGGILTLFIESWRHSNPICPENPKTPKFLMHFWPSCVFHVYGTANMQNMHVNCKKYTQKTMNNNETHVTTLKNQWKIQDINILYIYIYNYIRIFNIYIEFRCFGGICCGGILTLQKKRFGGPGTTGRQIWSNNFSTFLSTFTSIKRTES